MLNVASFPTDVPTLHQLLREQQHMIEMLKANLHLALHRQFGPRNEYVNVDQFGLFAGETEASTLIEVLDADTGKAEADQGSGGDSQVKAPATRKKAVRILKNLPREVVERDIAEADKTCSCCGESLSFIGIDSSEHLAYCPANAEDHRDAAQEVRLRELPRRTQARRAAQRHAARQEHGLGQPVSVLDRRQVRRRVAAVSDLKTPRAARDRALRRTDVRLADPVRPAAQGAAAADDPQGARFCSCVHR